MRLRSYASVVERSVRCRTRRDRALGGARRCRARWARAWAPRGV